MQDLLLKNLVSVLRENLPLINQRCAPYQKGVKTQDKGINKNFENLVYHTAQQTLTQLGHTFKPYIGDVLSDVALETPEAIYQIDAKGCHVDDGDFKIKKDKYFHGHCGIAQTSLTSNVCFTTRNSGEKTEQKGLQVPEIDGKPVYTYIVYMTWGFDNQYYIDTCGVIHLPHTTEHIDFRVGKSKDEMRWLLKDPSLYCIHQFSSESTSQTPDSTQ